MKELILGIIAGCVFTSAAALFIKARAFGRRRKRMRAADDISIYSAIEDIRAIGELAALKVITKEIVTAKDHWLGEWGKKYLEWLASSKKMAMIFEFDIIFKYNLRSPDFKIERIGENSCLFTLPRCEYDIHIRDIIFYDEQKSRFLPWLLPELVTDVFGSGFSEEDRNRLKEEARRQAETMARGLVKQLQAEAQSSARETIKILARALAAERIVVEFSEAKPQQTGVDFQLSDSPSQKG